MGGEIWQSVWRLAMGRTDEGSDFESRQGHDFTFSPLRVWCLTSLLSLGVKWQGREADSPPKSANVKNMWIYTSTLPHAFMV
jgi:hypothetical protein